MLKKIIAALAVAIMLWGIPTVASAQTVTNSWSSRGYVKVFTKKNCKGGHNWPLYRGKKAKKVKAILMPRQPYITTGVHQWFKGSLFTGERRLLPGKCYPLKLRATDKVIIP
jgi:hypothetical protein